MTPITPSVLSVSLAFVCLFLTAPVLATALILDSTGAPSDAGKIGCSLYNSPAGFPQDATGRPGFWREVRNGGATCMFEGLAAGTYAVAVSHDANSNGKLDEIFLGVSTEAWDVSNNARPFLSVPTFDDTAFVIPDEPSHAINIEMK